MKVDESDKTRQVPSDKVTVIDLSSKQPQILKILKMGKQPSGISVSPDGSMALVTLRAEGAVGILHIQNKEVVHVDTVKVCEPNDSIAHIAISPDGTYALASLNQDSSLLVIDIADGSITVQEPKIKVGKGPYVVDITSDGKLGVVANTMDATISILDVSRRPFQIIDEIFVGVLPEGVDISPDGSWMAVNCMQYTMTKPEDSMRQEFAQLVLLKRRGKQFKIVERSQIDRIPQAAVFSPDGQYLVVAGFEHQRLRMYRVTENGVKDTGIQIPTPGQPCTLRIADRY
jgi:DNA-binding beta-propeller fold protein YncE